MWAVEEGLYPSCGDGQRPDFVGVNTQHSVQRCVVESHT